MILIKIENVITCHTHKSKLIFNGIYLKMNTCPNEKFYRVGILLIESNYTDKKTNRKGPTFVLFKNRKWNTYTDLGGRTEKDEDALATVTREIKEETYNSIVINTDRLKSENNKDIDVCVDSNIKNKTHRTFIVCFDDGILDEELFNVNKDLVQHNIRTSNCLTATELKAWQETVSMKRFFIHEIQDTFNKQLDRRKKSHDIACTTADGESVFLFSETFIRINDFLKKNNITEILDTLIKNPIKKTDIRNQIFDNNIQSFLNGTKMITVL